MHAYSNTESHSSNYKYTTVLFLRIELRSLQLETDYFSKLFISEMHSKQWHYSLLRDFQNCYSTRRSPTGFFSSNSSSNSTRAHHTTFQRAKKPSVQFPEILRIEGKEIFSKCIHVSYKTSNDIPGIPATRPSKGTPVTPVTPETFQSFMTFQPFQAILQILQCSSISRESTPFQHSPITMHILHTLQFLQFDWFPQKTPPSTSWAITDITNIHSSKKGRCCDIGQIDRFSRIELFPLSSCQVIILIARMTFNCSTSCLMS